MTEWNSDMDAAPKDGQSFLGLEVRPDGLWTCWVVYCAWEENGAPVWFTGEHRVAPTHWQPLPLPPDTAS